VDDSPEYDGTHHFRVDVVARLVQILARKHRLIQITRLDCPYGMLFAFGFENL
jgi:hypothetical protein